MILSLLCFGLLLFLFRELYWKRRNLPPGPLPLPLIGNILPILWNPPGIKAFQHWKERYGPIYTYWLGGNFPIVTINDYSSIVVSIIYEAILNEAEHLMNALEREAEEGPVKVAQHLDRTVGNVINIVMFGFRFDEKNLADFVSIRAGMREFTDCFRNPLFLAALMFPWLRHIPGFNYYFEVTRRFFDIFRSYFQANIANHLEVIDYDNDDADDFTEAYLKEMHRQRDDPDTTFTSLQLQNLCFDLWVAGLETAASTMGWGTLQLLHNPEVIHRMHSELDAVKGRGSLVTIDDRPFLPYTNAVVSECQRWINIVPQNQMRITTEEVTIRGVKIAASTTVSPQISLLLHDPEIFPEPNKFDPGRFIDADGKYIQNKYLLPFSVGKRACVGEGLARMELFLFFANLVHRFELSPSPSDPLPAINFTFETMSMPPTFKCSLKPRAG